MTTAPDLTGFPIGARALDDTARGQYLALFDPTTGLPGRALLYDRLLMTLARSRRTGTAVGVLFVRFEGPPDDALVQHLAQVVTGALRIDDTIARTGPAELVLVCYLRDAQEARVVVRRIAEAVGSGSSLPSLTIGHATGTGADDPGDVLIRAASAGTVRIGDAAAVPPMANLPHRLRTAL